MYLGENVQFDRERAIQCLADFCFDLREGRFIGSVAEGHYRVRDAETIVRLSDDLETVSIHGAGDASFAAAFEFQRRWAAPLRLVDDEYSFELTISEHSSAEALSAAASGFRFPDD